MPEIRLASDTPTRYRVTPWSRRVLMLLLLVAALPPSQARARESADLTRALLEAARPDLPLAQRLDAASQALAAKESPDPNAAARAGVGLLPEAPETAGWLLLRATDAGWVDLALRQRGIAAVEDALKKAKYPATRADLAAAGLLLGRRPDDVPEMLLPPGISSDLVRAVLRREIGQLEDDEGRKVLDGSDASIRSALRATLPAARCLDDATADDPAVMRKGLDALVAMGEKAVPLLLHEARMGARARPAGRMPRAARAILALGFLEDKRATPVLIKALEAENGWVRVAAATALGDLGDPAGAPALAFHMTILGDLYRVRNQWDYPGVSATTVPKSEWGTVEYFVVDVAAADSLLRMGVPRAAGYLINRMLDPAKANYRIRVYQDTVDALARSLPKDAPVSAYNVDAGVPQRDRAFAALSRWWYAHRDDPDLVGKRIDETDPGFRREARALADRLCGTDIRMFMITKPACALLGRAMTPTLIETLHDARRGSAVAELAETLGMVRDPRAIPVLLGLLKDERPFVRARAAEALHAYVDGHTEVRDALLHLLDDRKAGPRVSALKGLVAAPPDPLVLAAVKKHRPARMTEDYARAETIVLLVQEGASHWPPVEEGLTSKQRYVREDWWTMLRVALDLPESMHDARSAPGTPHVRVLDKDEVLQALEARRATR